MKIVREIVNAVSFHVLTKKIISVNKRLDEWVTEERMDMSRIEQPQKDTKSNTPLKLTNGAHHRTDSRPPSPEKECHLVTYTIDRRRGPNPFPELVQYEENYFCI